MSNPNTRPTPAEDSENSEDQARVQPWFAVMLSSIVPALVSFALRSTVRLPAFILTGLLFVASCVLLYRQERDAR
jgi:hypothetical protein